MKDLRNRLHKEVDKKTEKFLELYQYTEAKSDAINSLTDLEDFVMGVLDKNFGGMINFIYIRAIIRIWHVHSVSVRYRRKHRI